MILIVMDTVRADHLSCYGYHRKTTPNIDRIATEGVLFENAYSAAKWSPPSHASIFTGKYPSYHETLGRNVYLDVKNTTLAEILKHKGYKTVGITNCDLLCHGSGFDKGFQEFILPSEICFRSVESVARNSKFIFSSLIHDPRHFTRTAVSSTKHFARTLVYGPDKYASYTNEIIKAFLGRNQTSTPFFLFVNYFDCHSPYNPPRPFKEKFLEHGFNEPRLHIIEYLIEKIFGTTAEKISDSDLNIKKLKYLADANLEGRLSFMAKELKVYEKEWAVIRSWYDGEIAYLDQCIGNIMNFLYDNDLFDNTLMVITSDHGENFGDHGLAGHRFGLYDSLLHIPLIMRYPHVFSGKNRISEIVSSIDIFPTIMSTCNINVKIAIQGKSLYPLEERSIHEFVCAECGDKRGIINLDHRKWMDPRFSTKLQPLDVGSKSIRNSVFKYIVSAKGEEQLYDISKDPQEKENIVNELPEMAKKLKRQMEKIINVNYFGSKESPYTETERKRIVDRLRALGYV